MIDENHSSPGVEWRRRRVGRWVCSYARVGHYYTISASTWLDLLATRMSACLFDGWELIDRVELSWRRVWVPVPIALAVGVSSRMENSERMNGDSLRQIARPVERQQ